MCLIHYIGGAFTHKPQDYLTGSVSVEIYDYNPLLFDFALKRAVTLPGRQRRLPASLFVTNAALGV